MSHVALDERMVFYNMTI